VKLSELKAIDAKIEQGRWVDLPMLPGISVLVRGTGNSDYRRLSSKLRSELSMDKLRDEAEQERIETKLLSETILLDWSGLEDIAFSKEEASKLLAEVGVFRNAVNYAANSVAVDGRDNLEADTKN
jgi:hypothetical protein